MDTDTQIEHRMSIPGRMLAMASALPEWMRVAFVYLVLYCFLDWISFVYPFRQLNITPWNPPIAASLYLLLTRGVRWGPALFAGALSADLLVRHMSAPLAPTLISDASEAVIYTGAVWAMLRLKISTEMKGLRDVVIFLLVTSAAAALMAIVYVTAFSLSGLIPPESASFLVLKYWVGDTIGATVLTPALLVLHARKWTFTALRNHSAWELTLQTAAFAVALWIMFFVEDPVFGHAFYPMFIPLVWLAVRQDLAAVALFLAIVQVGIIVTADALALDVMPVTRLQFLLLALSWTGLLLAAVISERERARLSASAAEARLRSIINTSPDGIATADANGVIEFANRNFESMLGPFHKSVVGQNVSSIFPLSSLQDRFESVLYRPQHEPATLDVSTARVRIGGRTTLVLAVRDISERKNAELKLRQHKSEAEQIAKGKLTDELAAVLAHEINQPLSAIVNYAGACEAILSDPGAGPTRAVEQLRKIAAQASRAAAVIAHMREFFRTSTLNPQPAPLAAIVHGALALLEDEIAKHGVVVDVTVGENVIVRVDRLQIEQVLINLLRNSLDALADVPDHKRAIVVAARNELDGFITVDITDTGSGIAPEVADTLFNPFVTTRTSGMGLGLSVCRSIVEAHGGRLHSGEPTSGGATFSFTIPVHA